MEMLLVYASSEVNKIYVQEQVSADEPPHVSLSPASTELLSQVHVMRPYRLAVTYTVLVFLTQELAADVGSAAE